MSEVILVVGTNHYGMETRQSGNGLNPFVAQDCLEEVEMRTCLLLSCFLAAAVLTNLVPATSLAIPAGNSAGVLFVAFPSGTPGRPNYVTTDRPYYVLGPDGSAIVRIYGRVSTPQPFVTISVMTPYGLHEVIPWNAGPAGYFSVPYLIDFSAPAGTYKVTVTYDGGQAGTSFHVMRS